MIYTESFPINFKPVARPEAVVCGAAVRFTVLTSRLIRLEYDRNEVFEDRPSQVFWYREQSVPDFEVQKRDDRIQIETEHLRLSYAPGDAGFTPPTLSITLKGLDRTWRYGDMDSENLGGTARTLDQAHGAIALEPGLVSRGGWAVVDDTQRLVFDDKGWLTPRDAPPASQDLYFFGYGDAYADCLRDYCRVAGQVPLLPRWALGNWWSRFWVYSADELLQLMHDFQENEVPLSVCIVDMDWHITDTGNRSSGWTGYTWNRDLFPDPPAFIQALHQLGLRTALNLHPALGVYPHEVQYPDMAGRMGVDPASEKPIPFDIADPRFTRAYFELLHHPYEAQGVDFWWMDWQQGTSTKIADLDPLWWLNHLHFYDLGRNGDRRSFIFSRWGGLGNHRYPIGFSGDTVVSWEALAFQPYFTATAANVGYGWWSHDIGGHMGGVEDAELFARWVQYGVFSPIFRLHCTKNAYHERLPWGYDAETFRATQQAMQLRHALIPYLYTMSWRNHEASIPLIRPMYHDYPAFEQAYHCPEQYAFGSELIVAPFIKPADPETRLSRQVLWLPPGQWFGFFSGFSYAGDGWHAAFGGLQDIPVFAKGGAIVPLGPKTGWGGVDLPDALEVHVFPGADNCFELYEDNGGSAYSLIPFSQTWEPQQLRFEIGAARGEIDHLPTERSYTLLFRAVANAHIAVEKNSRTFVCPADYDQETADIRIGPVTLLTSDTLTITLTSDEGPLLATRDHRVANCLQLLRACRLNTNTKRAIHDRLDQIIAQPSTLGDYELTLGRSILRALAEIITGAGVQITRNPADGSERVILWNNRASSDLTYRFVSTLHIDAPAVKRMGPLPRFAVLAPQGNVFRIVRESGSQRVQSVAQWFDSLPDSFRPETVGDLAAVIQFNFDGENDHQAYIEIHEQTLAVVEGTHDHPDLTIETDTKSWLALINGEVNPEELFSGGDLQVGGDLSLAFRLADLLGGKEEWDQFGAVRWKLSVNYLDVHTLEFGRLG